MNTLRLTPAPFFVFGIDALTSSVRLPLQTRHQRPPAHRLLAGRSRQPRRCSRSPIWRARRSDSNKLLYQTCCWEFAMLHLPREPHLSCCRRHRRAEPSVCSHGCSRSRASYGSPLQDEQTESGSPPHLAPLLKPSQQPQQQRPAGRGMRRAAGQPKLPFKQVCVLCGLVVNAYTLEQRTCLGTCCHVPCT